MTGKVDVVDCRDVTPVRLSEFLDTHSALEKAEEKMVKEILGPAFHVPAPFGEGQFVIRATRHAYGAYCVEGSWYTPDADKDPCGTWNFEITVYPADPSMNCVEIDWPGQRKHGTATLDPATVELLASKPNGEGTVNLMVSGGNVVYTIKAEKVEKTAEGLVLTLNTGSGKETLTSDALLCAVGRLPVCDCVSDGCGVEFDRRGGIVTDEKMRTAAEGIYAVGDVRGGTMLAHAAYADAQTAIADITGEGADN